MSEYPEKLTVVGPMDPDAQGDYERYGADEDGLPWYRLIGSVAHNTPCILNSPFSGLWTISYNYRPEDYAEGSESQRWVSQDGLLGDYAAAGELATGTATVQAYSEPQELQIIQGREPMAKIFIDTVSRSWDLKSPYLRFVRKHTGQARERLTKKFSAVIDGEGALSAAAAAHPLLTFNKIVQAFELEVPDDLEGGEYLLPLFDAAEPSWDDPKLYQWRLFKTLTSVTVVEDSPTVAFDSRGRIR